MREPTEAELNRWMGRLAQGDRTAFDPLFRALHPRALRCARARLGADRAADASQAALMKVFARASEFTPGCPVLPWFYGIVANEIRAIVRADTTRKAITYEDPAALWSADPDNPERQMVERELHQALEQAIGALDAPSAEAIGAFLGRRALPAIGAAAFRKRVSRAYARLRLLLGGFDGE